MRKILEGATDKEFVECAREVIDVDEWLLL
jgi:hypothetical protein